MYFLNLGVKGLNRLNRLGEDLDLDEDVNSWTTL